MKKDKSLSVMSFEEVRKISIWKRFFKIARKGKIPWLLMIPYFLLVTLVSRTATWFPVYQQKITGGDFSNGTIATALGILVLTILILRPLRVVFSQYVNLIVPKNLQLVIWKKVNKLPASFFDDVKGRELISRITEDAMSFVHVFLIPLEFYGEILALYFIVKELLKYDSRLAIFNIAAIPILILVVGVKGKFDFKIGSKLRESVAVLTHYLSDTLRNIPLVKIFVTEENERKKGLHRINKLFKMEIALEGVQAIYGFIQRSIVVGMKIGAILLGAKLVKEGVITIPIWITFYMFLENSMRTSERVILFWSTLKQAQGSLDILSAIVYMDDEDYIGKPIKKIGDIEFKDVTFSYDEEKDVLKNVNFKIPYGTKTAIVGASGSGKTTILSLIERLYKVNSGSVELDGVDINELDLNDLRQQFSYVTQSFVLYSGTIFDNLVYGVKRAVSKEDVIKSAKQANIHDFIMKLPQKYDTKVSEAGGSLSGGERQRIALANAFLCDSKYLLLDEATSNLDADSEAKVCRAVENIGENKTVITIAHRLKTIMDADQIIMLNDGAVFDIGTHCELMDGCEVYKELVEAEFYAKGGKR